MARIEPEEEDFDPDAFSAEDATRTLAEGVRLFNAAEYHAAHESFEKCWLATHGDDADLYKGLIQASICMHHFRRANLDGARKLYSGHRKLLGRYLPSRCGIDVEGVLAEMQRALRPVLRARGDDSVPFSMDERPILPVTEEPRD